MFHWKRRSQKKDEEERRRGGDTEESHDGHGRERSQTQRIRAYDDLTSPENLENPPRRKWKDAAAHLSALRISKPSTPVAPKPVSESTDLSSINRVSDPFSDKHVAPSPSSASRHNRQGNLKSNLISAVGSSSIHPLPDTEQTSPTTTTSTRSRARTVTFSGDSQREQGSTEFGLSLPSSTTPSSQYIRPQNRARTFTSSSQGSQYEQVAAVSSKATPPLPTPVFDSPSRSFFSSTSSRSVQSPTTPSSSHRPRIPSRPETPTTQLQTCPARAEYLTALRRARDEGGARELENALRMTEEELSSPLLSPEEHKRRSNKERKGSDVTAPSIMRRQEGQINSIATTSSPSLSSSASSVPNKTVKNKRSLVGLFERNKASSPPPVPALPAAFASSSSSTSIRENKSLKKARSLVGLWQPKTSSLPPPPPLPPLPVKTLKQQKTSVGLWAQFEKEEEEEEKEE